MAKSTSLQQLAIGIDIGGTGTKFGIVDRNGNILFSSEISSRNHSQVEDFIDELHGALYELIERAGSTSQSHYSPGTSLWISKDSYCKLYLAFDDGSQSGK